VANPELGTKRVCPETGRKFFDLNKDPIVSPYTGKTYPLSFFETIAAPARASARVVQDDEPKETPEVEETEDEEAETVSLEEVDEEGKDDENLPDIDEEDDVDLGDDDDDTFLEEEEDEDDDLEDIVRGGDEDDDS
jgi:uncharacterized protein (TIGR02300 family)